MLLHAFNTWFVANLLYPLMLFAAFVVTGEYTTADIFHAESITILILIVSFSAFFSVPSLFVSRVLLRIIVLTNDTLIMKFIAWLFAASLLVMLDVLVTLFLFSGDIEIRSLLFALPAIAATWVSILIRWKQFVSLVLMQNVTDKTTG
ncbi:MAG: hypothetical protein WDO16_25860 [Bacteroidota bacterium]